MELSIQYGFGMMEHSKSLVREWQGGTVILSPRDLDHDQLLKISSSINDMPGGRVLLDPQFYLPHSDHERLTQHSYWPQSYQTGVFFGGPQQTGLLKKLFILNDMVKADFRILPSELSTVIDDDWCAVQVSLLSEARSLDPSAKYGLTIAITESVVSNLEAIGTIIQLVEKICPEWCYVVAEHPNGDYLVDQPVWVANVLDLIAGLKLAGSKVLLGYCNHQLLLAGAAKVDKIASGAWMNVRSFASGRFRKADEGEVRKRSIWYYCPHAFSEYKVPFLDVAFRTGVLDAMRPREFVSPPVEQMFGGTQPSNVGFTEQASFRHYLTSLHFQAAQVVRASFAETVNGLNIALDEAESTLSILETKRVSGQLRDFADCIEVNRAALAIFLDARGAMMKRKWNQL